MDRFPAGARAVLGMLSLAAAVAGCEGGGTSQGLPAVPRALDLSRWDPSFYRESEVPLDGEWRFRKDPDGTGGVLGLASPGAESRYGGTIVVPFPWQSRLSGLEPLPARYAKGGSEAGLQTYRGTAWYARTVEVPATWTASDRREIRFGAVDWKARVYVDGQLAATHEGGYDPFRVDVTAAALPGGSFFLAVEVEDPCDGDPSVLNGLQGGAWYTCAGGIWQEVALVSHPATHVASVRDVPGDSAGEMATRVTVRGEEGEATVRVTWACMEGCPKPCGPSAVEATVAVTPEGGTADLRLEMPAEDEWSAESPCLAGRTIEVTDAAGVTDVVRGYLGTRRIRAAAVPGIDESAAAQPYGGILVNDRLVYVRAAMDPGYHPEGIVRFPSPEVRQEDLAFLKRAGFNAVRLLVKAEEPRFFAMADAMGLYVIHALPSPSPSAPSAPGAPWNDAWDRLLEAVIARDANHPSILWWVLFHQAWGLSTPGFWKSADGVGFVRQRYLRAKALDPTRPVEDNSATLYDGHAESDLATWQAGTSDIPFLEEIVALLESGMAGGGAALLFGSGSWSGQPWINTGFGGPSAGDAIGDNAFLVHGQMNVLRRHSALTGYVLRQAYDVEWGHDGLQTYDRRPKDLGLDEMGLSLADLFGEAYLVMGQVPVLAANPGADIAVPAGLSTPVTVGATTLEYELRLRDGTKVQGGSIAATRCGPGYTALGDVAMTLPQGNQVYVLAARVMEGTRVAARNALYVVADDGTMSGTTPTVSLDGWSGWIDNGTGGCVQGACWCDGNCSITYSLWGLGSGRKRLKLVAEMASHEPEPQQTDDRPYSSRLDVELYGEIVGSVPLPDAPNDHRGVLSLLNSWPALRGAYGRRVEVDLGTRQVNESFTIRLRGIGGGLTVFGRKGGRLLETPRIEVEDAG